MRELNIDFLEKYKQVDRFLKDAWRTTAGVNEYITQMERRPSNGRRYCADWIESYNMLKHARWARNQFAHDASIDDELITEEDYEWLCMFYDRLLDAEDPIAQMMRAERKQEEARRGGQLQNRKLQPGAHTDHFNVAASADTVNAERFQAQTRNDSEKMRSAGKRELKILLVVLFSCIGILFLLYSSNGLF